jgi:hypothetical protein
MEELSNICKTMLDNANLDIFIKWPPGNTRDCGIILNFVVGGSLEKIVIYCGEYTRLRVTKDADEGQCFFVGETNIELITSKEKLQNLYREDGLSNTNESENSRMFRVQCDGGIQLDILCGTLTWKMDDGEFHVISKSD